VRLPGAAVVFSQSDLRANFGLGKAKRAEIIEITWPSGQRQTFRDVEADKFYLVEEGKDQLELQHIVGKQPQSFAERTKLTIRVPLRPDSFLQNFA
jgi:hypothetical protein